MTRLGWEIQVHRGAGHWSGWYEEGGGDRVVFGSEERARGVAGAEPELPPRREGRTWRIAEVLTSGEVES